jgi:hypothetical protein
MKYVSPEMTFADWVKQELEERLLIARDDYANHAVAAFNAKRRLQEIEDQMKCEHLWEDGGSYLMDIDVCNKCGLRMYT